jgi:hypothetical protein
MSKDNKKGRNLFLSLTGMWKRVSTTRVGKDGKPEPYWYGKVRAEEDIVITKGSEMMLFPSTKTNKSGGPEYFLKVRQPSAESETSEEVEVADS